MDSEVQQKRDVCLRVLDSSEFYKCHDRTPFAICKECLTVNLDVSDLAQILEILKELNTPFVLDEWVSLVEKNPDNPKLVLGKYLSKMKLQGWKSFTYKDTYMLNKEMRRYVPMSERNKEQLVHIAENILREFCQT